VKPGKAQISAKRGLLLWLLLLAFALSAGSVRAQSSAPVISQIQIVGNQRVEANAIKIHIASQSGQPLNETQVDADVKAIYKMGFFEQVSAEVEPVAGGTANVLVFRVKERPFITDVRVTGMKKIKANSDEAVAAVKLHDGAILDPLLVSDTIKGLRDIYQAKGYLDANVVFDTIREPDNSAIGIFRVTEGPLVEISAVDFVGNNAFSARRLRQLMETRKHNILSRFWGTGVLDRSKLSDDIDRITAFYYNHGFLQVHIGEPAITRHDDSLVVTIDIDEGPVFNVGSVDLGGDLKYPRPELAKELALKPKAVFNGTTMQHDVLTLSDFYSNRGYAFVNVDPQTQIDPNAHIVNITYAITPGNEILVNRIRITGNTKTSDKVIRRELQIQEQEPYSSAEIQDSKKRLDQLGFFQSTRISTTPSTQPDDIDLDVNVQEANTASFQVGGGYDSLAGVFGSFTLSNSNLFGGGQSAAFNAEIGYLFQDFTISYTEPWFLDMPLSLNVQLFDDTLYLFSFNQSSTGFTINTTYPLAELGLKRIGPLSLDDVTAGLGYQFESVGITGLAPFTTFQIQEAKGFSRVSEIMPSLRRFTIDNPVDPRSGSVQSLNLEVAGLGGVPFLKGVAHVRWFIPFIQSQQWGDWVNSPSATFGMGTNLQSGTGGELPLFERFFPGGLNGGGDVRGYELYSLGPQITEFNQFGQPFSVEQIGGSKELLFSDEVTFPLLESLGLRGEAFLDAGQAYLLHSSISVSNLQYAYGVGVFWKSPFGPISVDIARPINPRPNDQNWVFDFGAGAPL